MVARVRLASRRRLCCVRGPSGEMADAPDLGSGALNGRAGSTPASDTTAPLCELARHVPPPVALPLLHRGSDLPSSTHTPTFKRN
jgi:hypothetical protein